MTAEPLQHLPRQLTYADRGGMRMVGDFYASPAGFGLSPVLVAVHGGAWKSGGPESYTQWGCWLAARGCAVFAIRYTLATPEQPGLPHALADVCDAVAYLSAHSAELNVDPDRIGVMGDSGGAQLAALCALGRAPVAAAILLYGPFDLIRQWNFEQISRPGQGVLEQYLGGTPASSRAVYEAASPIFQISKAHKLLPMLVSWGTADVAVDPDAQSRRFVRELEDHGGDVRAIPIDGAGHRWFESDPAEGSTHSAAFAPALLAFIDVHLRAASRTEA